MYINSLLLIWFKLLKNLTLLSYRNFVCFQLRNNLCKRKHGEIPFVDFGDLLMASVLITSKDIFYDRFRFTLIVCSYIHHRIDFVDLPTPAILKVRLQLINVTCIYSFSVLSVFRKEYKCLVISFWKIIKFCSQ